MQKIYLFYRHINIKGGLMFNVINSTLLVEQILLTL